MVFRGVAAGPVHLGTAGIHSGRDMPLVTLLLFIACITSHPAGKIHEAENHLGIRTSLRATVQQPRHHVSFLFWWVEQAGQGPLSPLLKVSTFNMTVSSTIWFSSKNRDNTRTILKSVANIRNSMAGT